MPVDRRSPTPLWAQILDDLRQRLSDGEFQERFPTDVELLSAYNVSRQTVREAVRHLQQDGLLERTRGRGTFVRQRRVEAPLGALYSLFRTAEDQGFVQESTVRSLEVRTNERAATALGCRPDEPLVYLERLRFIDGTAAVLDCSWLPRRVAAPLLSADFHRTALYQELAERCGLRPDAGWERLVPALPTAEQRRLLGLAPRAPVFSFERLACQGTVPVEWRHGVIRADRFSFVARYRPGNLDAGFEHTDDPA